jgi:hypothetical protein
MLKKVTFTGVDNKTNIEDLVILTNKYPFVEFGVLVSKSVLVGDIENRFPHLGILKKMKLRGLNLSCHVCGSVARDIVKHNDWSGFYKLLGKDIEVFDRFQLNVSGIKHFSTNIEFPTDKTFIIQLNNNLDLYNTYKHLPNVLGFQDASGGKGVFYGNWMDSDGYFGYAGGLNAQNVEDVIQDLLVVNNGDFWIDMETSVRTNGWFDVEKCEEILKICEKYIQS